MFLSILLSLLHLRLGLAAVASSSSAAGACPAPTLEELLVPLWDQCPKDPHRVWADSSSRVVEMGELTLEESLILPRWNNRTHIAVLYHASWCPFSKQLRPVFDSMSILFPSVIHLRVEESSIRPGLLSKHGVYSFPVLYIHGASSRTRYSGSRTIKDLTSFYVNTTGLQPKKVAKPPSEEASSTRSPEPGLSQRLQNDTYLVLASWFLVLRVLWMVLPVAVHRVKTFWDRCHLYKMLMPRSQNEAQTAADRRTLLKTRSKRKRRLPGWSHQIAAPASSLAIAESSARRLSSSGDDLGR